VYEVANTYDTDPGETIGYPPNFLEIYSESSSETYTWITGSWGYCSVSCGGGTQTRTVGCQDSSGTTVADSFCSGSKPADSQQCNTSACEYDLNIGLAGTGTGKVTSTPAGIDCGADCDESFTSGAQVTLNAEPGAGSTFSGWSGGGCSGTGACVATMDASKTVTATFAGDGSVSTWQSADVPKDLQDNATVTSTLPVTATELISDVDVVVNLTHTFCGDLDIFLIAPNATRIELSSGNGSDGDNYTDTTFDDEAATPVTDGSSPFSGAYRPEGMLAILNGLSADGTWTLEIHDSASGDTGQLVSWSLLLKTGSGVSGYTLVLNLSGTGTGSVVSSPPGIDCGTDCNKLFGSGSQVTLSAFPGTGSIFTGWSGGGCSGTGDCVFTMDAPKSVTADFDVTAISGRVATTFAGHDDLSVVNAAVSLDGTQYGTQTDSDGNFTLELAEIQPGDYDLTVILEGLETHAQSINISEGQRLNLATINMTPAAGGCTQSQLDQAAYAERLKWDANGDGKIGLEEAIRALQIISGITGQ